MNRSILIILCDFLLVTLVAFSNVDSGRSPQIDARTAAGIRAAGGDKDVVGTLKLALEDEKQSREKLTAHLQTSEQALAQHEQKVRQFQESLRKAEELARQLEQERAALSVQASVAQARLTEIESKLAAASTENIVSKTKLESLQADLKRQEREAESLQLKLTATERAAEMTLAEKQQLNAQLQVSEVEKRLTREQVAELRGTVAVEREDKAKLQQHATSLATNVASLAQKSVELTQELRDNRALAPNAIYSQFLSNRITAKFDALRAGYFGRDVTKEKTSQCVIFTEGAQNYLLFHVDDTPLTLWNPGTDWNKLSVILSRGKVAFSGVRLSFLAEDPRIVVMPIGLAQAKQFNVQIYQAAADPFRFQEAVIVGANEGYYGESRFQIDPTTPHYVKLDRSLIRGLFGKFNPSRGDLVLTKTGELLGIMANSEYCAVLNRVTASRTIQLGSDISGQQTGQLLSQLHDRVGQMPVKLQ